MPLERDKINYYLLNKDDITMERKEIEAKLIELARHTSPLENPGELDLLKVSLFDDLGFDSMSFIQYVLGIEETFGITIDDEMLLPERFASIQDTVDFLLTVL